MKAKNYLWTGRMLVGVVICSAIFWEPPLMVQSTTMVIAALFYSTAGIINAIEQARAGARPEKEKA